MLSPDGDAEALAEAVVNLAAEPERAKEMGKALQQTIEEKYNARTMAEGYLTLFKTMVKENKR